MDNNDNVHARLQAMQSAKTATLDRLTRKDDNLLNLAQGSSSQD
jgi:hypothetical protein